MKLSADRILGRTGIRVPGIIFGTSTLGNLYSVLSFDEKRSLMSKWFECTEKPVVVDCAGKYGAGLALEVIGRGLFELGIEPDDIVISNKLGWYQVPLTAREPAFEPGVWKGLAHDCVQQFGYDEIRECFNQGNQLLGGKYNTSLVSVHDPDEYLAGSDSALEWDRRLMKILDSYRALFDLKREGRVRAVGIGSKDWNVIRELYAHVPFDWVMLANSFTIFSHPAELQGFMARLHREGVGIINSAVFHGGFLTGGLKFDYREADPETAFGGRLFRWREAFHEECGNHGVDPGNACLQFGLSHPAIAAVSLNTSKPEKMDRNVEAVLHRIPESFWDSLRKKGIIDPNYPYI